MTFNEERSSVTLRLTVKEGNKQRFGATYFNGNTVYLPSELLPAVEAREHTAEGLVKAVLGGVKAK